LSNFDPEEIDSAARTEHQSKIKDWKEIVAKYHEPNFWKASWQIVNTLGSYAALWCLMYFTLKVSWVITFLLAALSAGFLIRIFIIFHDCGHGSFFKSRAANNFWGFVTGMLTFTPYYHWRWEHGLHHSTAGDLSKRGMGDVWTLTVQEYLEASRWKRFSYRLARNPIVLFVIAPIVSFVILERFPSSKSSGKERHSVWWMNLALLSMATVMSFIYGIGPYLIIQLTIMAITGSAGIWFFYVQHQFEDVYWERSENWDYTEAALKGSSFYKLPKILQWFSGNIGFHHIHHLSPRIPNYNLEPCHKSDPMFQDVKPITLFSALKSLTFRLWDESAKKLVGYRHLRDLRKKKKNKNKNKN